MHRARPLSPPEALYRLTQAGFDCYVAPSGADSGLHGLQYPGAVAGKHQPQLIQLAC
jgi:hypothetical protein